MCSVTFERLTLGSLRFSAMEARIFVIHTRSQKSAGSMMLNNINHFYNFYYQLEALLLSAIMAATIIAEFFPPSTAHLRQCCSL